MNYGRTANILWTAMPVHENARGGAKHLDLPIHPVVARAVSLCPSLPPLSRQLSWASFLDGLVGIREASTIEIFTPCPWMLAEVRIAVRIVVALLLPCGCRCRRRPVDLPRDPSATRRVAHPAIADGGGGSIFMRLLCRGCLLLGAPAVPPWVLRLAALKGATPPSPHTPRGDGAIHVALRAGGDVERVQTLLRDHGLVGFDVRGRGPASAGTDECSSFSSSFSSFSSSPPLPRAAMLLRHSSVLLALFTPHHAPRPLSPPAIINLSLGWWPSVGVSRRSTGADWKIGQHPRVRPRDRRGIGGGGGGGAAGWWWSWAGGKSTGPGRGRAKRGRGGGNIRYLLPMIFRADLAAPARRMASSWDRAGTGSQRGPKQPPRGAPFKP